MPQKHRKLESPISQQPRIKRQDLGTPNPMEQHPAQPPHPAALAPLPQQQHQQPLYPVHPVDPETSDTWAACAKCALSIGHLELAFRSCQSALDKNPANALALSTISATYREDDMKTKGDRGVENALNILNDAIRMYPSLGSDPLILKELAHCQALKGFYDQAHATLEHILSMSITDPEVWLMEGKALIRMGARAGAQSKNMAVNAFRSALDRTMKPLSLEAAAITRQCHSELAAIAFSEGNLDGAALELSNTLALPLPDEAQKYELSCTWCALAVTKEANGDIQGAMQICDTAEKVLGLYPRLLITEAYLLLIQPTVENAVKAAQLLQVVIQKTDDHWDNKEGDFLPYYLLGCAYAAVEDPSNAYEALHVALSRAPASAFPWLSVGALYLRLGQLRDSLAAYSKAAKLKEEIVGYATAVVTWKGLDCVYERCDKQFSDAANACTRAAEFARLAGDMRTNAQLEQRSHALLAAARGEAPVPKLQQPPEPPLQLLRDLTIMSPDERIELMNRQNVQQQQIEQQAQPLPQAPPMQQQSSLHFQRGPPPPVGAANGTSVAPQAPSVASAAPGPPGPSPQQFSPRQQVGYQQQFSPHHQVPGYQGQYIAPVNREGQSTPLSRPVVSILSPSSGIPANGQAPQYHYGQGKAVPPINPVGAPQIRPGGQYAQFPHPTERPREYI
ncbi:hypothetical protein DASC09_016340 [Saccharomycopsis crataegensis]|uniref:Uncharacterized protein n=1 Tax=Saccharomycopsis crataegensis TaxID=43959 RepID=A0AAV5QI34_9ASCO|nr:hypothetical protein DASC09_016340 [Saccharomycopsis crataegensis]